MRVGTHVKWKSPRFNIAFDALDNLGGRVNIITKKKAGPMHVH